MSQKKKLTITCKECGAYFGIDIPEKIGKWSVQCACNTWLLEWEDKEWKEANEGKECQDTE